MYQIKKLFSTPSSAVHAGQFETVKRDCKHPLEAIPTKFGITAETPLEGELRRSPRTGLPSRYDNCHVSASGHRTNYGSERQVEARLAHRQAALLDVQFALRVSFAQHADELGIQPSEVDSLVSEVCNTFPEGRVQVKALNTLIGLEEDCFESGKRGLYRALQIRATPSRSDRSTARASASAVQSPRAQSPAAPISSAESSRSFVTPVQVHVHLQPQPQPAAPVVQIVPLVQASQVMDARVPAAPQLSSAQRALAAPATPAAAPLAQPATASQARAARGGRALAPRALAPSLDATRAFAAGLVVRSPASGEARPYGPAILRTVKALGGSVTNS